MSNVTKIKNEKVELSGFDLLRSPFDEGDIGQLPRRGHCTKEQWESAKKGECKICGGYHSTAHSIHIPFVGHAAVTNRLNKVDPEWSWEPLAIDQNGLPTYDRIGGLWIKLKVLGKEKIGYGNAGTNATGDTIKEVIGDAIRNAAMRFGVALEMWHKGELNHQEPDEILETAPPVDDKPTTPSVPLPTTEHSPMELKSQIAELDEKLEKLTNLNVLQDLYDLWQGNAALLRQARRDNSELYDNIVISKDLAKTRIISEEFPV